MTLRDLGFSSEQELVCRLLVEQDYRCVDVVEKLGLPVAAIERAVDALVDLGVVQRIPDAPLVRALNVLLALGRLIEVVEDRLALQQRQVAATFAIALNLAERQAGGRRLPDGAARNGVERVDDLATLNDRLEERASREKPRGK